MNKEETSNLVEYLFQLVCKHCMNTHIYVRCEQCNVNTRVKNYKRSQELCENMQSKDDVRE